MLTLTDDEYQRATGYVQEFSDRALAGVQLSFECLYRSHDFADTRMVLRLQGAAQDYALKIDLLSPSTSRLQDEFRLLNTLSEHFARTDTSRVIEPVYLSPEGAFFVTEFIDRPTAVDLIHNSTDDGQIAQLYRRAGAWLHELHSFQPAQDYGFRPRWMTDSIAELLQTVPTAIRQDGQPMADVLYETAQHLKGVPEIRVFAHGDFHGQNLIVGRGSMIGLDFTEAQDKLAIYDIVDFLKSDVFRDAAPADVDRSGIVKTNKDMFFRRYRHPINMQLLDFCVRARLLKDWLELWQTNHSCSPHEEDKRHRLGNRLQAAFQQG